MTKTIESLVRPNILALKPYISFRDSIECDDYVFLDANENPFGTYNRYPDSTQKKLKEKLAQINSISSNQLSLGNGSDELIDLIINIFCSPQKDAIAVLNPSFAMYEFYAAVNENPVIKLNLDESFDLQKEEFQSKLKNQKAKVLFLCTPNNPTGISISDVRYYVENFKGIVVVDEAYVEFSDKESALNYLNDFPNLIVLKTLSKAYGMAGLRIGMAVASPFITQLIQTVKSPYNMSNANLQTALELLENEAEIQANIQKIKSEKAKLKAELEKLSCVTKIYPSDANFFLVEFSNCENLYSKLVESKILTSKRFPSIPNALRINVGSEEENNQLIKTLSQL